MPDYLFIFGGIVVGAAILIVAMFRVREIFINWKRGDPDYHSEQQDDSNRLAKRDRLDKK